jgi:catechol 2,3-dioxygenase-like lactoylglutathione lyase family enzyme
MIDHVQLRVSDLQRSVAFYEKALAPLGHTRRVSFPGHQGHAPLEGFGDSGERYLMLREGKAYPEAVHLAFVAKTQRAVREFYEAALAAGGRDNGLPADRPQYFSGYYAAYVLDLDGYNIEALHQP